MSLTITPNSSETEISPARIVEAGFFHYNKGDPARALECFRRAIKMGDESLDVRCFAAHSLHALGQTSKARASFFELVKKNPRYMPGHLGLASLLRLEGGHGKARSVLLDALKLDPRCVAARQALCEVVRSSALEFQAMEKLEKAQSCWEELQKLLPEDPETRRELHALILKRKAAKKAGTPHPAQKAGKKRRDVEEEWLAKARGYQVSGHWKKAQRILRGTIAHFPRSIQAYLDLFVIACHQGDSERASAFLQRAKRLDVDVISNPQERFQALLILGRFPQAFAIGESLLDEGAIARPSQAFWWSWYDRRAHLRSLSHLVKSAPSPWAYYYRGLVRGAEGASLEENKEDLAYLSRLSNFKPSRYGWMNVRAGQAYLNAGQCDKAARILRRALKYKPIDWTAHGYLAEALLCLGLPAAARKEMRRAQAAAPKKERGQVLAWRGELELWRGHYDEAFRLSQAACGLGAIFAFCWRGAAKLKQGKPREALKYLDQAVKLHPIDLEAYVWRGQAKWELGLLRESLEDFNRAPDWIWSRCGRALVRAALKDYQGMKEDFNFLPGSMAAYLKKKAGFPPGKALNVEEMREILKLGFKLSRGFRRNGYGQMLWMT